MSGRFFRQIRYFTEEVFGIKAEIEDFEGKMKIDHIWCGK